MSVTADPKKRMVNYQKTNSREKNKYKKNMGLLNMSFEAEPHDWSFSYERLLAPLIDTHFLSHFQ